MAVSTFRCLLSVHPAYDTVDAERSAARLWLFLLFTGLGVPRPFDGQLGDRCNHLAKGPRRTIQVHVAARVLHRDVVEDQQVASPPGVLVGCRRAVEVRE